MEKVEIPADGVITVMGAGGTGIRQYAASARENFLFSKGEDQRGRFAARVSEPRA